MSGQRNKKRSSVRDRVAGIQKPKIKAQGNGGEQVAVETMDEIEQGAKPKKTLVSTADYLAAQLHEAQSNIMDLRAAQMNMRQALLQKDQVILNLETRILNLEAKEVEKLKEQLRETHGLRMGRTMKKDEKTGEIFWLESEEQPSKQPQP